MSLGVTFHFKCSIYTNFHLAFSSCLAGTGRRGINPNILPGTLLEKSSLEVILCEGGGGGGSRTFPVVAKHGRATHSLAFHFFLRIP